MCEKYSFSKNTNSYSVLLKALIRSDIQDFSYLFILQPIVCEIISFSFGSDTSCDHVGLVEGWAWNSSSAAGQWIHAIIFLCLKFSPRLCNLEPNGLIFGPVAPRGHTAGLLLVHWAATQNKEIWINLNKMGVNIDHKTLLEIIQIYCSW